MPQDNPLTPTTTASDRPRHGVVQGIATSHTYPAAKRPGQTSAPSPASGPQTPLNAAPGQVQPLWQVPPRSSNTWVLRIVFYILGALGMLVLIGIIMFQTQASATLVGFILAFVPLSIVLAGVLWLDRWEPEPRSLLAAALLWGAGVATLTSLVFNTALTQRVYESVLASSGDPARAAELANIMGPVVIAPIVEEIAKGLGLLLIFLFYREHFDGPVDGVVYAGTVAAGFAFTENILYFAQAGDLAPAVFVVRGLASPFAHLLYTAMMGLALGLTARKSRKFSVLVAFPIGLIAAMGLHALWNGSATLGTNFYLLYVLVQLPLFLGMVGLLIWLRRQEANVVRARLGEYAQVGWFAAHEVDMLSSLRLRSQARAWAANFGASAKEAMRTYQRDATALAYLRQRVLTGRAKKKRTGPSEAELLAKIQSDRETFARHSQGSVARA